MKDRRSSLTRDLRGDKDDAMILDQSSFFVDARYSIRAVPVMPLAPVIKATLEGMLLLRVFGDNRY